MKLGFNLNNEYKTNMETPEKVLEPKVPVPSHQTKKADWTKIWNVNARITVKTIKLVSSKNNLLCKNYLIKNKKEKINIGW